MAEICASIGVIEEVSDVVKPFSRNGIKVIDQRKDLDVRLGLAN